MKKARPISNREIITVLRLWIQNLRESFQVDGNLRAVPEIQREIAVIKAGIRRLTDPKLTVEQWHAAATKCGYKPSHPETIAILKKKGLIK